MAKTLDEAIAHAREVASEQKRRSGACVTNDNECDKFSNCMKCSKEYEQLAEWLEELKVYRETECNKSVYLASKSIDMIDAVNKGYAYGYNKAIDDFVKFASDMPTVEEEDGEIRPMWLEEMAEQLKRRKI